MKAEIPNHDFRSHACFYNVYPLIATLYYSEMQMRFWHHCASGWDTPLRWVQRQALYAVMLPAIVYISSNGTACHAVIFHIARKSFQKFR
ncbi:hypothetical protein BKA93DRAFT_510205 [Sparassis latifolia]